MSDVTGISTQSSSTDGATALTGIKAAVANLNTDKLEASTVATLTGKTTPVNADSFPITDSVASNVLKNLTFTNLKAFLKTYFDTLYPSGSGTHSGTSSGTNTGDQTLPVKATGAELDTGTDDAKFSTAKALVDSHNVPSVAPSTSGNVMTSNGTDWTSVALSLPWTKISTITITNVSVAQSTAVSLGQWTGLTGDTDDVYLLVWEVKEDTGNGVLGVGLRFNSDSTSGHYSGYGDRLTTVSTVDNYSATVSTLGFVMIPTVVMGKSANGEIYIKASKTIADTGRNWHAITGSQIGAVKSWGAWTDTTNQITTIDLMMYQNDGSGTRVINGKATLLKLVR